VARSVRGIEMKATPAQGPATRSETT